MSLVRDLGITLPAMADTVFVTCSNIISTGAASTTPNIRFNTTADAIACPTGGTYVTANGRIIDRLLQPLGTAFNVAMPSARWYSSLGSTEANRMIGIGVKLQHGDSSGGGDMADYSPSTGGIPEDRAYFSTARSTDHACWDATLSTGVLYAASNPAYYDLRGAKRYIRTVVRVTKNRVTTETSGDELARVGAQVTFLSGAYLPIPADVSSPFSTSTSTS